MFKFRVIIILAFALIIIGLLRYSESEYFSVVEINFVCDYNTEEDSVSNKIDKILKQDILDKLDSIKGKNIFRIDLSEIEKKILKDARVKNVNISRSLPSKINVCIKERKAVALVRIDKFYGVDQELNIFSKFNELDNRSLPTIYFDETNKKELSEILKKIIKSKIYKIVSEIKLENEKGILVLTSGTKVYFEKNVEIKRLDEAFEVYERDKNKNIEYIETRFNAIYDK